MGARHDLKSPGCWVEFRDVGDVRSKDRKRVHLVMTRGLSMADDATETADTIFANAVDSSDLIAAVMISDWCIPYISGGVLPSADPELIGELKTDDHRVLMDLCEPFVDIFVLTKREISPDDHGDPNSPSVPASA